MELSAHTSAVIAALEALGTFGVYRGQGPSDPLGQAPYWVVYAGLATTDGPSGSPWADVYHEVQITSVGSQADQAEYMADAAFAALIGQPIPPPAGRAWLRTSTPVGHVLTRPVERDDDFGEGSPLFYVVSIFDLPSTPA